MVHGWNSTINSSTYVRLCDLCIALGYNVFMLTLRGHDDAAGSIHEVTREDHRTDIDLALAYMRRQPDVDTAKLIGVGSSYGAYLLATTAEVFAALLLRAPALYPDEGWNEPTERLIDQPTLLQWRSEVHTRSDCSAFAGMHGFVGKLLIVTGGLDADMPAIIGESYARSAPLATSTRIILSSAGHVFAGADKELFLRLATAWLEVLFQTPSSTI